MIPEGVGNGIRIDFTTKLNLNQGTSGQFAQLFIPDYYVKQTNGEFTLVFHLHSASWAAEDEVYKIKANVILFNIHLGSLSSPYQNYFSNQSYFQKILDTIVTVLKWNNIIPNAQIKNIVITSFSAGYAGIREIFKTSAYYNKINALTLADGLHCNSDSANMNIQMKDFTQFAKDARDGTKIFYLTHSSITTSGYENTTQTANYLINRIGAIRIPFVATDEIGTQYSKCDTGNFHLKGYNGTTGDDHMKHLYNMHKMLLPVLKLLNVTTSIESEDESKVDDFNLYQNYPNPFNAITSIRFSVISNDIVTLKVFNILGKEIATLVDEKREPGTYEVEFSANDSRFITHNLSSGVYFYQLKSDNFQITRKMILLN